MRRFWQIVKKIFFWTFFVSLTLFTTLVVLLHIYEDEIKQMAIDEINSHLNTDLEVQSIELSVFHDFPRASLEFRNVLIRDAYKEQISTDTLLYSRRAYLTFNVWDIWNGDYTCKRMSFQDSKLNLKTQRDGDINYDILKESEDTTSSEFRFVLELLRIDNLNFAYDNLATGQHYKIDVVKGLVKGDFTQDEFEIKSESDLFIRKLKSNSLTLIRNKPAHLDLSMNANTVSGRYDFTQGDITIGKMPFELLGYVDSSSLDLTITGKNIELADLANSLAAGTMPDATRYEGTGILSFSSQISGGLSTTEMPSVTADFKLKKGTLTNPSNQLKLYDVNLDGSYQNAQKDREELLSFQEFDLKLLNSFFSGKGEVRNFAQPSINARMNGNLDLAAFNKFFRFPGVEKIGGLINLNLDIALQLLDPQYRQDKFSISRSKGTLSFKDVQYKQLEDPISYEQINGELVILDNDAAVKDFRIRTPKSDLVLNGAMTNLLQYLAGYGGLGMVATLESNHIDLNEFIGETNAKEDDSPEIFELPKDLNLNVDLNLKDLQWDHHNFKDISGKLFLLNRKADARNFTLKTLGGVVNGNLSLSNLVEGGNVIEGKMSFRNIQVKSLFTEWKNFDQETITDQHLSGVGSGTIDLLLFFNPYFSVIEDKIYALSDITIQKGELNELETMRLITDYMRSNKGLKLLLNNHIDKFEDKLMHLKFATLSNTIEIKNRKVYIPKMTVASNALDVNLFGWHDFDNNVEYHFSFRFRELKSVPEYTEFGKIEDDGLGLVIYITMTGPIDDPTFALDTDERKNDIKENLAQEKQDLKSILKSEFGLFKSDTTVKAIDPTKTKEVEFIFYEEEDVIQHPDSAKSGVKNKDRSNKFFNKLKEDSKKDEEKVEFGDDL